MSVAAKVDKPELTGAKLFGSILIIAVLGATTPPFAKFALDGFGPFSLAWVRFFSGGLIALAFLRFDTTLLKAAWKYRWLGLIGALNPIGIFLALEHIPSNTVPFFFALTPTFSLIYIFVTQRKIPKFDQLLGFLLGLAGVGLITFTTSSDSSATNQFLGFAFLAMAVAGFWIYSLWSQKVLEKQEASPQALAMTLFVATTAASTPLALLEFDEVAREVTLLQFGAALMIGVLGTALFYLGLQALLKRVSTAHSQLFTYLQPPAVAIMAFLVLGETVSVSLAIGGALALAGAWLASRK